MIIFKGKVERIDKFCFYSILIDIFFIPLFPSFSVSISLPILLYWFLIRGYKTKVLQERKYFSLIIVLMTISTFFSLVGFEGSSYDTTFSTSLKRFFQYLFSFWYYFFFVYIFKTYKVNINNIIFWGIIYIGLFALIYFYSQDLFITIKRTLCPFDPQVERWLNHELPVYRFNFLWADPNNVAYAIGSLSLFYIVEDKKAVIKKYVILLCLLFTLLCTMSLGGIVVITPLILVILFFSKSFRQNKLNLIIGLLALLGLVFFIYTYFDFFYELINSGIIKRHDIYDSNGSDGAGGRSDDFMRGLGKLNPIFLFVGSGQEGFVTEIGHLYLLCMYGLPVYIYFMYIMFRKFRRQTYFEYFTLLPIFVGFSMNIAIGEQKFLLITLLISAYYTAKYSQPVKYLKQTEII